MMRAAIGIFILGAFSLLPLAWLAAGVPWMTLVVTFVLIPIVDALAGRARPQSYEREPRRWARWVPRAHLVFQIVLLVAAVRVAPQLTAGELAAFALAVGTISGGIGITVAHELGHRASRLDRAIAKALLVTVGYGHFIVEHVRGHHVRVATPDDPASAPRGMNVYRFVLRSIAGSFAHAWRLEAMRLAATGRAAWHLGNWTLTATVLSLLLLALAAWAGGGNAIALMLGQAAWAVALLEIVNYIEHYGLQRRRIGGRYEPVAPRHSWDADHAVSNFLLFNLQRHADHHAEMQRPFETLRPSPDAPQLPAGYPLMIPIALVPPLWFALMDARLPQPEAAG
jgi:alkane 1-monooxygenase